MDLHWYLTPNLSVRIMLHFKTYLSYIYPHKTCFTNTNFCFKLSTWIQVAMRRFCMLSFSNKVTPAFPTDIDKFLILPVKKGIIKEVKLSMNCFLLDSLHFSYVLNEFVFSDWLTQGYKGSAFPCLKQFWRPL